MPRLASIAWLVMLPLLSATCAVSDPAPSGWRRSMKQAQKSTRGAWIAVTPVSGRPVAGELIAVDNGGIYIASNGEMITIPYTQIKKYSVSGYRAGHAAATAYTVLGTLSTLSHGFFLVATAPTWMITGGLLSRSQSGKGFMRRSKSQVARRSGELRAWARFPQGLPDGFAFGSRSRRKRRGPAPGTEGGACYRNGTCNDLLYCDQQSRKCLKNETVGQLGGACYPNATCNAGLVCDMNSGVCKASPQLGQEGGPCYANGACDGLLLCIDSRCQSGPTPSPGAAPGPPPPADTPSPPGSGE